MPDNREHIEKMVDCISKYCAACNTGLNGATKGMLKICWQTGVDRILGTEFIKNEEFEILMFEERLKELQHGFMTYATLEDRIRCQHEWLPTSDVEIALKHVKDFIEKHRDMTYHEIKATEADYPYPKDLSKHLSQEEADRLAADYRTHLV